MRSILEVGSEYLLNFYIQIGILPMFSRLISTLYSKLWASMKAAQAHYALLLHPDRLVFLHLNRLYRAFSCTQSASNTIFIHRKPACKSCFPVINWLCNSFYNKSWCRMFHSFIMISFLNGFYDCFYFCFCIFCEFSLPLLG